MERLICFPGILSGFLFIAVIHSCFCYGESNIVCHGRERTALLRFKQGLINSTNRLSSWVSHKDCCKWEAVGCDNTTGHVIKLDLRNPYSNYQTEKEYDKYRVSMLNGEINSSILELKYLNYLDLSWNNFTAVPEFFGSLKGLRYLILANSRIGGVIPFQLGNLTNLLHLDLSYNYFQKVPNLGWLSYLSSLEYLDMSSVDLQGASDWLQVMKMLPSLVESHLSNCLLDNIPPSLQYVNFTSLAVLDISNNSLEYTVPTWFYNLSGLSHLDLSFNKLKGQIPDEMGNMNSLEYLDFSRNIESEVEVTNSLWNLCNLKWLDLSYNNLNGEIIGFVTNISTCIGKSLEKLDLSNNQLTGHIPEWFGQLNHLKDLDLSVNSLFGPIPAASLGGLSSLTNLDPDQNRFNGSLHTGVSDLSPKWFWDFLSHVLYVNISNNQFRGDLSDVLLKSRFIDLSSNHLEGQLPRLSPDVGALFLSKNSISGSLSRLLCENKDQNRLLSLDLSENLLSENLLSGEVTECWMYWPEIRTLNLASNNLSGNIPTSMGSLHSFRSLHLRNNSISGHLPSSLQNCRALRIIDVGENTLYGNIPSWIGEKLKSLFILRLRSNKLSGCIPQQICNLTNLQVLDLAHNSLSEAIPLCLDNIDAMVVEESTAATFFYSFPSNKYVERLLLVIKGIELEYTNTLRLVKIIDLSSNNLHGEIPQKLWSLAGLRFLNLSGNHLTGNIPENINKLKLLESLDFSRNHLSGEIPKSMSSLTFLSFLNLSCNNLSGRIPIGTQLQSFSQLSYADNPELCGVPLSKNCTGDGEAQVPPSTEDDYRDMLSCFYISMVPGFTVGFCGVCGVLFFKQSWRNAYFCFLGNIKDQIYVAIALKLVCLRKKVKRSQVGG